MIEHGEVIKTEKDNVVISFERKTACDKCGMCAFSKDEMNVKLTLKNKIGAKVGDIVEVSMGDRFVLISAIIVYLVPLALVGMFLGIGIACNLQEYIQIILCLVGFVLGFIISSLVDKVVRKKIGFSPKITKIISHSDDIENKLEEIINK